ncbi:MAG: hypothetical protein ACRC6Z_07000, partial [Cetobacterium sp.]
MRYILIFSMLLFAGCFSLGVRGEYRTYQNKFYKFVSNPINEKDRNELKKQFENLKTKISSGNYSKREKEENIKD